jgi:peptide/nickel transport system substrate-binding protein
VLQALILAALLALGGGAVAIAGITHGATDTDVYREALVVTHTPLSLDPLVDRADPAVRDVGQLLYRRLLRLDAHATPTADLAESWGVSGDGLSYRFSLQTGVRWSDGTALTVRDVQATVALVQAPGFPDASLAAAWRGVSLAPDGSAAVTVTLPQARASFAAAASDLPILPAASLAHLNSSNLSKLAGRPMPSSGPFRISSSDPGNLRLVPNRYAGAPPPLHGVDLRLVKSFESALQALAMGQVDGVVATTPAQRSAVRRLPGLSVHDVTTFRFVDLLLNEGHPGLDDPAVRHAIAGAVDRKALIAAALGRDALPQVGAIPAGIAWIAPVQQEVPSPELSARALDAAGWTTASDGVRRKGSQRLVFTLTVPDAAPLPAVAAALSRQLDGIQIAVEVHVVKADSFEPTVLVPGSFDMVVADWDNGPDPDVSSFWRSNASPPHGFNVSGGPPDPFLDRALDSLATVTDTRLRRAAAGEVDARLAEDTPAVFLYAPEVTFAVSDQFAGVSMPAVGTSGSRFDSIASWHKPET